MCGGRRGKTVDSELTLSATNGRGFMGIVTGLWFCGQFPVVAEKAGLLNG